MSIARLLANDFEPHIRERGHTYFEQGRVRILRGDANEVEAEVRGSRPYFVRLKPRGTQMNGSCECEYAALGAPCKHMWATLLAADSAGLVLGGAESAPAPSMP